MTVGTFMDLQLGKTDILRYASQYNSGYDFAMENITPQVKHRGYLTMPDLFELLGWLRLHRSKPGVEQNNSKGAIETKTKASFASTDEEHRIECLMLLHGVRWSVASTILHWFHNDDYPIYTTPALAAVQFDKNAYKNCFDGWINYVSFCREKAKEYNISIKTLDRALREYSKHIETAKR